uniref:Uncharacterized protein n=1 Tax=Arundo donax TaxID=35708 RepID=A0A0A8XWZ4_ARUDO
MTASSSPRLPAATAPKSSTSQATLAPPSSNSSL